MTESERLRDALRTVLPWVGVHDNHMACEAADLYATRVLSGDKQITLKSACAELIRAHERPL